MNDTLMGLQMSTPVAGPSPTAAKASPPSSDSGPVQMPLLTSNDWQDAFTLWKKSSDLLGDLRERLLAKTSGVPSNGQYTDFESRWLRLVIPPTFPINELEEVTR